MGAGPSVPKDNVYPTEAVDINELVSRLRTGDILCFSGNTWSARLVRLFAYWDYSHVGMVHWRVLPGHVEPVPCLWESVSTIDELPCLLHGNRRSGVRLVSLVDKLRLLIAGNSGWGETRVCVVPLLALGGEQNRPVMEAHLRAFEDEVCGARYSFAAADLLSSAWGPMFEHHSGGGPMPVRTATPSMPFNVHAYTCSQLVARTLVRMRAYAASTPVDAATLRSFTNGTVIIGKYRDRGELDQTNYHWRVQLPVLYYEV